MTYTLSGGWTGAAGSHNIRLEAASFTNPGGRDLIDSSDGTHSIILDLTDGGSDWTGTWTIFRWDMFNGEDNTGGKEFTVNSVVYSNSIAPIPEPTSVALFGLGAHGLFALRRR